jgi:hypothetical protein
MMARPLRCCILVLCCLAFFGCTLKTIDTMETGDKTSVKSRVLIATQNSEFKRTVVSEIKKALGDGLFYIKMLDIRWLPNEAVDDYDAIVILNRCMAGRPDPRVESFIDTVQDQNKVIVLATGRLDSWKPESSAVDAMTSASTMSESAQIGRSIADKAMAIINSRHSN